MGEHEKLIAMASSTLDFPAPLTPTNTFICGWNSSSILRIPRVFGPPDLELHTIIASAIPIRHHPPGGRLTNTASSPHCLIARCWIRWQESGTNRTANKTTHRNKIQNTVTDCSQHSFFAWFYITRSKGNIRFWTPNFPRTTNSFSSSSRFPFAFF